MNSKNEVFEYLIGQLRQQLPVVNVVWLNPKSVNTIGTFTIKALL